MNPFLLFSLSVFYSLAATSLQYSPCSEDKPRQELRSKELQKILKADQDEREKWMTMTPEQMNGVARQDEARRKRVGEIFGEGCFLTAKDYAAAAMVYQHGSTPDHFFQTFLWSKRAVEEGDSSQRSLMALGLDRYLVSKGQKQLFASQALRPGNPENCWCLQPIEKSFPETLRKEYVGKSLPQAFEWLKELNQGKTCPNKECSEALKPSPKGSVPGFW